MYLELLTKSKREMKEILSLPMNLDKTYFTIISEVEKEDIHESQYKHLRKDISFNNEIAIVESSNRNLKGVYVNGKLIEETKNLTVDTFVGLINTYRSFAEIEMFNIDGDYLNNVLNGRYPKEFKDIKNKINEKRN
ncbi:hypothetical protein [Priestia megaterium]|uniref:hypothetical protein n=1 Tax=Priestia megaterium TaxID=1404 RepID=UPI00112BA68C|nr:hypothetical protein [Priestia megaterium]TPF18108.1 hypothetical protein CBE78_02440 [Priestia megaterium]TPF22215.1 hypothetical protein CBE79_04945 [Priestia megaterium]